MKIALIARLKKISINNLEMNKHLVTIIKVNLYFQEKYNIIKIISRKKNKPYKHKHNKNQTKNNVVNSNAVEK